MTVPPSPPGGNNNPTSPAGGIANAAHAAEPGVYLQVGRPTPDIVQDLLLLLDRCFPDLFFVGPDETLVLRQPDGLEELSHGRLFAYVDSRITAKVKKSTYPVPDRYVKSARQAGPFGVLRRLTRLVCLPHLIRDSVGQVVWRYGAGYDAEMCSWHDYPVPATLGTREDFLWLTDLLFGGFNFESRLSRWFAEAALLTPLFRPLVRWVPAFLIWATVASAGKTYLSQLIGRVHLGVNPRVDPIGVRGWERDYAIGTALRYAGPAGLIILDNLAREEVFDNAILASILTAQQLVRTPRIPKSDSGVLVDPAHLTVFATGISPKLGPEIRRRFFQIRLLPRTLGPSPRTPDQIERELDQNRARVVAALVWAADHIRHPGFQVHPVEVPSYVEFGRIAGGLLMALYPEDADEIEGAWATIPDLLLRGPANEQDAALLGLLAAVPQDSPGVWPFTRPGQLLRRLEEDPACEHLRAPLASLLAGEKVRAKQTRLGMRLHLLTEDGISVNRIGGEERSHRGGGREYRAVLLPGGAA